MSNEQRILDLEREKDRIEARVKDINKELEQLMNETILAWGEREQTQVKIGGATLYISSRVYVSPMDDTLPRALAMMGEDWLVKPTINSNTLSSWVNQTFEEDEDGNFILPPALQGKLKAYRKHSIKIRGIGKE